MCVCDGAGVYALYFTSFNLRFVGGLGVCTSWHESIIPSFVLSFFFFFLAVGLIFLLFVCLSGVSLYIKGKNRFAGLNTITYIIGSNGAFKSKETKRR